MFHRLISLVIPGQYTYSMALLIHPSIPVCHRSVFFFISDLMVPRITIKFLSAEDETIIMLQKVHLRSDSRRQQEMEHWPCRVAGLVVSPSSGFGVIRLVQFHREYLC